jgi:hypothetical protein
LLTRTWLGDLEEQLPGLVVFFHPALDAVLIAGACLRGVIWPVARDTNLVATLMANAHVDRRDFPLCCLLARQLAVLGLVLLLGLFPLLRRLRLMDLTGLAHRVQAPPPAGHSVCRVTPLELMESGNIM